MAEGSNPKKCKNCGEVKTAKEFHRHPKSPDRLQYNCKSCCIKLTAIQKDKRFQLNPVREWAKSAFYNARTRARSHGVRFDLDVDFLVSIAPESCPVLGTELNYSRGSGKNMMDAPSVDRIIPANGYVRENVAVISVKANMMKSNGTMDEIWSLWRWLVEVVSKITELNSIDGAPCAS